MSDHSEEKAKSKDVKDEEEKQVSEKVNFKDVQDENGKMYVMLEDSSEELQIQIDIKPVAMYNAPQTFLANDFPPEKAFGQPEISNQQEHVPIQQEQVATIQQEQGARMAIDNINQEQVQQNQQVSQQKVPIQQNEVEQQVRADSNNQQISEKVLPQVSQQDDQEKINQQIAQVQLQLDDIVKTMKDKKE